MEHILQIAGFKIVLEIQEKQIPHDEYEHDCDLWITVQSDEFSGRMLTGTSRYLMEQFGTELSVLQHTLKGEARLCDPFEYEYDLEFCGDGKGHIKIKGEMDTQWCAPHHHVFRFENEVDQTQMLKFVEDICRKWRKANTKVSSEEKKQ